MEANQKRVKRKPENKKRKRLTWTLAALSALVIVGLTITLPLIATRATHDAVIRVPRSATARNLTDSLTKYLGEDYARTVMHIVGKDDRELAARYGAYEIKAGTSALKAAHRIMRGAETSFNLTINGVRDFDSFLPRIAARFNFPADSLRMALSDPGFMKRHGISDPRQAQALFLNDTYSFYWTATPSEVAEKISANYEDFWTPQRRARADSLGVTPLQLAIVASIVDEETNLAAEKGAVGRLYINRLRKGMRLQADPTVRYAVGDFTIRRVTSKHTAVQSPYNTYRVDGLPPGPIRTTSKATMQAILDSRPHDYIYMCAKEDFSGGHNFAVTYDEHRRNAARYQAALDRLGVR